MVGITAIYVDADTFTISRDHTSDFIVGRRIKANCGVDGYKYGTVESSSYSSPNTTVNLVSSNDDLTTNLAEVWYSSVKPGDEGNVSEHPHGEAEGSGGTLGGNHTVASHSDTTATGAELEILTNNSIANALHRHTELVASDGSPDPALSVDATGRIDTDGESIHINSLGSGNRNAVLKLVGDATYVGGGLYLKRDNTGVNSDSDIVHRGTGVLNIKSVEVGSISLFVNGSSCLLITSDHLVALKNGTGINEFSTDVTLTGNSDDAAPTEKAVKTYVDANPSGSINYVKVSDVKSAGTHGGTFTSGAWRTRDLNTEDSDTAGICALSSNQITLAAGTYECRISTQTLGVDAHKAKLRNVTGSVDIIIGTSEYSAAVSMYATSRSFVVGKFTIAASQALEVQHRCVTTYATFGFGVASNMGVDEVYTVAEFWRVG